MVVLTKADLCEDCEARKAEHRGGRARRARACGLGRHREGLAALNESLAAGQTAVLLGSSGVGKSSLVNALAGTR